MLDNLIKKLQYLRLTDWKYLHSELNLMFLIEQYFKNIGLVYEKKNLDKFYYQISIVNLGILNIHFIKDKNNKVYMFVRKIEEK